MNGGMRMEVKVATDSNHVVESALHVSHGQAVHHLPHCAERAFRGALAVRPGSGIYMHYINRHTRIHDTQTTHRTFIHSHTYTR